MFKKRKQRKRKKRTAVLGMEGEMLDLSGQKVVVPEVAQGGGGGVLVGAEDVDQSVGQGSKLGGAVDARRAPTQVNAPGQQCEQRVKARTRAAQHTLTKHAEITYR